ncbi:hypothetical protein Tco_1197357, partial [Tanacetum coccineum]
MLMAAVGDEGVVVMEVRRVAASGGGDRLDPVVRTIFGFGWNTRQKSFPAAENDGGGGGGRNPAEEDDRRWSPENLGERRVRV